MTGVADMITAFSDVMAIFATPPMSYYIASGLIVACIGIFAKAKRASSRG